MKAKRFNVGCNTNNKELAIIPTLRVWGWKVPRVGLSLEWLLWELYICFDKKGETE